jgi:hypothetical protein
VSGGGCEVSATFFCPAQINALPLHRFMVLYFDYLKHLPERVGVFLLLCIKQLEKKCIFFKNFCRNILRVWEIVVPLQHKNK